MSIKISLLFLIAFSSAFAEKVKVTVYYETHCPCSVSFIKKQLYPNYLKLNDSIILDLVPYGNTKRININGTVDFECKKDCKFMKIHACAINEGNVTNKTVNFINCLMDGKYTEEEINSCVKSFGVNWKNIQSCVYSSIGHLLLDNFGYRTASIGSAHIPAVVFNDAYDDDVSQQAREDFLATVCGYFTRGLPQACLHINEIGITNTNVL